MLAIIWRWRAHRENFTRARGTWGRLLSTTLRWRHTCWCKRTSLGIC